MTECYSFWEQALKVLAESSKALYEPFYTLMGSVDHLYGGVVHNPSSWYNSHFYTPNIFYGTHIFYRKIYIQFFIDIYKYWIGDGTPGRPYYTSPCEDRRLLEH